jgi:hypothetical protein
MCGVEWVSDEGVMCGIVEYNGWIYVETGWGTDLYEESCGFS